LSSIANGLPLALLTFYPGRELEEKLEDARDLWRQSVECLKDEKIVVRRGMRFTDDFMRCVRLWVAARSFGLERKEEASLEELKELSKLFKSEGMKEALVSRTLNALKPKIEEVEKKEKNRRRTYSALGTHGEGKVWRISHQNFLAHAGLEYNVTEVHISGKLRYSKKLREKVLNACQEGLFRPSKQ
jgi:CRISPR-associated protein Csx1